MQEFKLYSRRAIRRIKIYTNAKKWGNVLEIKKSAPSYPPSFMGDRQLCKRKTM
jgi:hypothetical protein